MIGEPFACKGPHYKLVDYGPDMLFQGALEEQHDANPKVTAAGLAASLGFVGSSWKTAGHRLRARTGTSATLR